MITQSRTKINGVWYEAGVEVSAPAKTVEPIEKIEDTVVEQEPVKAVKATTRKKKN